MSGSGCGRARGARSRMPGSPRSRPPGRPPRRCPGQLRALETSVRPPTLATLRRGAGHGLAAIAAGPQVRLLEQGEGDALALAAVGGARDLEACRPGPQVEACRGSRRCRARAARSLARRQLEAQECTLSAACSSLGDRAARGRLPGPADGLAPEVPAVEHDGAGQLGDAHERRQGSCPALGLLQRPRRYRKRRAHRGVPVGQEVDLGA
jgi:hypothetical protein